SADVILCLGNSTQLNVTGATTYQWSPLEGLSCTNCSNPIANPKITTPYLVEGSNSFGCVDTDTVIVTVIQPLHMTNSGNDSICIGKSTNLLVSGAASYLWTPSAGLSSTTISNPIANPIISTKYRVVGYDGYNCFTDTAFIVVGVGNYPTVNLGPDRTLSTGTILPLKALITNGPIKNWLWTPTTNLDCINCALPNAHIKKDITYSVEVTTAYGCKASDTINIKVFCENTQVFIPNAFTPDGDGVNDILMVRGTGIVTVKSFRIFNRWGVLVFEKNNFPPNEPTYGWDGRINGKVSPSEVYVYTAEVLCENGVSFIYKGNTTILK
ncbi:MAG: gliding motility-associated C-terminal domain-containing protein, partial [Ginsengibacter sp.]